MERLRPSVQFNYGAMQSFYVDGQWLTSKQFDSLIENTNKIRNLNIEGINWMPIDQASGQFRDIALSTHYEAMARAAGFHFTGIEDFYISCIKAGVLPPYILNRTQYYENPSNLKGLRTGKILTKLGMISDGVLQRALGIQAIMESETGIRPFFATIINQVAHLSAPDLYQTIGFQVSIEYESLDDSADKIAKAASSAQK